VRATLLRLREQALYVDRVHADCEYVSPHPCSVDEFCLYQAKKLVWIGILLYVDWGSRCVGDMIWCSVVGTGLSGPTLSVL
jgi:hypothetical protein